MAAVRADGRAGFPGPLTALRPPGPTFGRPRGQRRQGPKLAPFEPRSRASTFRSLAPRPGFGAFAKPGASPVTIAIPSTEARSEPLPAFAALATPVPTPFATRPEPGTAFGITHRAPTPAGAKSLGGFPWTALAAVAGCDLRGQRRRGGGRRFAAALHPARPSRATRAVAIPAEALPDPAADLVRTHLAVAVTIQLLQPLRRRADLGCGQGAIVIGIEAGEEARQAGGPGRRHGRLRTIGFGVRLRGIALGEGGQAAQRGSQQGEHDFSMSFHGGSSFGSVRWLVGWILGLSVRWSLRGSVR